MIRKLEIADWTLAVNASERITDTSELFCAEVHEELTAVDKYGWSLVSPLCSSHTHASAHHSDGGSPGKKRTAVRATRGLSDDTTDRLAKYLKLRLIRE